ncbi:uncharacterized protein LOC117797173 [Ailuropoda melanoleuca]|uniref:uncharacterized protein LOC117797173 n=1 Tax=Ailuropoda melanoleuca TaxID=9646 RepID=UPI0014940845|nr:uncharacterized protein LOC117797173 [Ailuropoda melanoleuca]
MPSQQGRRHKEALSPAKRRPSARPPAAAALPAGKPLPCRTVRPLCTQPCPLQLQPRPGEWPSVEAPQAGEGTADEDLGLALGEGGAGGRGGARGRGRTCGTCGTCGRGAQRAGGAGIWDGSLADCVLAPVADWAPRRHCRIAAPLRVLTSDVCVCMLCVVEIRTGPTRRAASPPQLRRMRMPQPREEDCDQLDMGQEEEGAQL